jgi:hypothetical protein
MGRGRAKAKQQKVARELKYNSQSTDLDALQRELGASPHGTDTYVVGDISDVDDDDEGDDTDDDEDDRWTSSAR